MEIKAISVTPKRRGYEIIVNRQTAFGGHLTVAGIRLLRIIEMFGAQIRKADGDTIQTTAIQEVFTTEVLQAKLNQYAEVPIKLTFGEPIVTIPGLYGNQAVDAAAVDASKTNLQTIRVTMRVRGSLPLLDEDCQAVQKLTDLVTKRDKDDVYQIILIMDLYPGMRIGSPRQRMMSLRPLLGGAIV